YLSEGQVKMEPIEIFYGTLTAKNKTEARREYHQEELQILQDLCEELKGYLTMLVQSGYNSSNQSICAGLLKLAEEYSQCGMNYGSQLICALAMDLETQYGKLKKSWSVVMADFTACVRYQENMAKKLEWEQVKCNQKEVSG
ncbi:MAG: hypothetical protein IJ315_01295, partial [Firmicutes bacterium]|nr:hypothetical protein [Bacillota bacterium]